MSIAALVSKSTLICPHEILANFCFIFLIAYESLTDSYLATLEIISAFSVRFDKDLISQICHFLRQELMKDQTAHLLCVWL